VALVALVLALQASALTALLAADRWLAVAAGRATCARRGVAAPSSVLFRTCEPMMPDKQAAVLLANLPSVRGDLEQGAIVVIERSRSRLCRLPLLRPMPNQRDQ